MANGNNTKKVGRFVAYQVTPDLIAVIHFFIVLWIISGTVVMFFNREYIATHMLFISLVLILGLFLGYCPLTKLEEVLRKKKNSRFSYDNSFVAFHFNKLFGTNVSSRQVQNFQLILFSFSYGAGAFLYFVV